MSESKQPPFHPADTAGQVQPAGVAAEGGPGAGRRSGWRRLLFVIKAIEIRLRFVAVLAAIGLVIGYWETIKNYWEKWTRPAPAAGTALAGGQEFYCPMHPSVVRDTPDPGGAAPKCPICGMPLSKRAKGEAVELPAGVVGRVQLSPYRVQLAGVQTEEIALRPLVKELRSVGYVTFDEARVSRIVARVEGYLERLHVDTSFAAVRQGDPLAEIYSPALYLAAQELALARRSGGPLVESARTKLRLLGVSPQEIREIEEGTSAGDRLLLRSPHAGHVFQKQVFVGDHVVPGQMLFEVADLSSVWVEAEVYEKDLALLQQGQRVEVAVEALPGRVFSGEVSLVHPHVESATRTNRVRFALENPQHLLRPGMYATVRMAIPVQAMEPFHSQLAAREAAREAADDNARMALQETCPVTGFKLGSMGEPVRVSVQEQAVFLCCAGCEDKLFDQPDRYLARLATISAQGVLAVPAEAVIDTGEQQVVYVEREPGLFEGVAVRVGPRAAGYYPVISGLLPGDRVASAGAFLIDAETRLNPAAAGAYFGASGGPEEASRPQASRAARQEP